jgi:hypothetical protein
VKLILVCTCRRCACDSPRIRSNAEESIQKGNSRDKIGGHRSLRQITKRMERTDVTDPDVTKDVKEGREEVENEEESIANVCSFGGCCA